MEQVDRIEYGFDAGSVPPMFYRRLELLAEPGALRVKRWEGENSPVEEIVPLSREQFAELVAALPELGLANASTPSLPADEPRPTGGGSEWVRIESRGRRLVGGGAVRGDVAGLRDLLQSFVP